MKPESCEHNDGYCRDDLCRDCPFKRPYLIDADELLKRLKDDSCFKVDDEWAYDKGRRHGVEFAITVVKDMMEGK